MNISEFRGQIDIPLFSNITNQLVASHILTIKHPQTLPPPSLPTPNPPPTHPRMPGQALPTMCRAVGPQAYTAVPDYLMKLAYELCTISCMWIDF